MHDEQFTQYTKDSTWFRYADNLVYAVPSVLEGEQALGHATQLLKEGGLALKGQDGPPADIRKDAVQLLGFTLTWNVDRLEFGLGDSAWSNLSQRLLEAHKTANPPETATKVVIGWLAAYGPAFSSLMVPEAQLERILAENGFREAISPLEIKRQGKRSWQQWRQLRKDSNHAPLASPLGA